MTLVPDALLALDALVARVTDLEAQVAAQRERLIIEQADHDAWAQAEEQRDAYRVQSEAQASEASKWRKRAEAAEAQVAALVLELEAAHHARLGDNLHLLDRAEAAEAALAQARQALAEIAAVHRPNMDEHERDIARRALAAAVRRVEGQLE